MLRRARGLLALALLAAGPPAAAECAINRPIRVAFYDFGINYDPKTKSGRDVDLIAELSRRTGCRFERVFDSRVRIWKQMEQSELDMTVSALESTERDKVARFVLVSYARDPILVHLRPGFPVTADEFLANHSLMVGLVNGFHYSPGVDEWVGALRRQNRAYEAPDVETLMRVFDAGRVAAIPIKLEMLPEIGRRYRLAQPWQRVDWFASSPKSGGGLALSRSRLPEALATQFHETVERMRQDGTLQRIAEKYTTPELALQMLSPNRWGTAEELNR